MIESDEDGNKMPNRTAIKSEVVIISGKLYCATYPHAT